MRVLVTGSNGYLGGRLVAYLSAAGHAVTGLGRDCYTFITHTTNKTFGKFDWTNKFQIESFCEKTDLVIHAAGPNAEACLARQADAENFHHDYTKPLLEACVVANVPRFFFLSSIHVYTDRFLGSYDEGSPLLNKHPYAKLKQSGEKLVSTYWESGFEYLNLRLSNVIGVPATPFMNAWNLVANNYAFQLATTNKIWVKDDKPGSRDFLPMSDFLSAINFLMNQKELQKYPTFNICSSSSMSVIELANLFVDRWCVLTGYPADINFHKLAKKNESGLDKFWIKNERLSSLDFEPRGSIEDEVDNLLTCVWNWKKQEILS